MHCIEIFSCPAKTKIRTYKSGHHVLNSVLQWFFLLSSCSTNDLFNFFGCPWPNNGLSQLFILTPVGLALKNPTCWAFFLIWTIFTYFPIFHFSIFRSGGGGGGNGGGNFNNFSQNEQNYNTFGLSTSFLENLGIQAPLHTKIFVANVSIFWSKFSFLRKVFWDVYCCFDSLTNLSNS